LRVAIQRHQQGHAERLDTRRGHVNVVTAYPAIGDRGSVKTCAHYLKRSGHRNGLAGVVAQEQIRQAEGHQRGVETCAGRGYGEGQATNWNGADIRAESRRLEDTARKMDVGPICIPLKSCEAAEGIPAR
jgi:hypothetical protein